MIHKNLELWIPVDSPSDDFNDADSEEEFIDALTTVRNILQNTIFNGENRTVLNYCQFTASSRN